MNTELCLIRGSDQYCRHETKIETADAELAGRQKTVFTQQSNKTLRMGTFINIIGFRPEQNILRRVERSALVCGLWYSMRTSAAAAVALRFPTENKNDNKYVCKAVRPGSGYTVVTASRAGAVQISPGSTAAETCPTSRQSSFQLKFKSFM